MTVLFTESISAAKQYKMGAIITRLRYSLLFVFRKVEMIETEAMMLRRWKAPVKKERAKDRRITDRMVLNPI